MKFLPQQPDLSGVLGEQVLARESHRHREALGAFAHQHDVAGMLHHRLRDQRHVLNVPHSTYRASASRWAVHAAGIELDNAFFVGETTEANTIVLRIIFRALDDFEGGIKRIAAAFQEDERVLEIRVSIVGTDDDGTFERTGLRGM